MWPAKSGGGGGSTAETLALWDMIVEIWLHPLWLRRYYSNFPIHNVHSYYVLFFFIINGDLGLGLGLGVRVRVLN